MLTIPPETVYSRLIVWKFNADTYFAPCNRIVPVSPVDGRLPRTHI